MASIRPTGTGAYRVQVYVRGVRDSTTKPTRKEAAQWALERESELSGRKLPEKTLADAMRRYASDVAPQHRGERWEVVRISALLRMPIARHRLSGLTGADMAVWRDWRRQSVSDSTVAREMNLLRSVLEYARRDLHWIRENPLADVRWPQQPRGRRRRLTPVEVDDLAKAFGVHEKLLAETATQRVGLAFLFALETAMRSSEILGLTWQNVYLQEQFVRLPRTKNGDQRDVPLSTRAIAILRALPKAFGPVFGIDSALRDALWRKVRDKTPHTDIHFHDTRSEAIWRLSKKLDVLPLARMIGHRDPKSLLIYFDESASDMAKRLG